MPIIFFLFNLQILISILCQDLERVPEPPDPALIAVLLVGVDVEPQVLVDLEHRMRRHLVEDGFR